jgi:hypothetical protein
VVRLKNNIDLLDLGDLFYPLSPDLKNAAAPKFHIVTKLDSDEKEIPPAVQPLTFHSLIHKMNAI